MSSSYRETFAYAKVNLALAVTGSRADGYHELQSVMQSISLHDVIRVRLRGVGITCRCGELSGPDNLAYRAAEKFARSLGKTDGIEIEIDKRIPFEAGLAGGSSDAAAVLRVLNELYGLPLTAEELRELAGSIGADVAFCLDGGTMWATGRGEILEKLPPVCRLELVVAKPVTGVNTKEAYRRFDEEGKVGSLNREAWIEALMAGKPEQVAALLSNDLEDASIRMVPEIGHLKSMMLKSGCYGALMSGSGSAVFGLVQGQEQGLSIARVLRARGYREVWTTSTLGEY